MKTKQQILDKIAEIDTAIKVIGENPGDIFSSGMLQIKKLTLEWVLSAIK